MSKSASTEPGDSGHSQGQGHLEKKASDEDRRQQWTNAILKEDFTPNASSVVGAKNFDSWFILTKDSMTRPDGTVIRAKRGHQRSQKAHIHRSSLSNPKFKNVGESVQEQTLPKEDISVLMYNAGYIVDIPENCKYLKDLDRGGLKWPSEFTLSRPGNLGSPPPATSTAAPRQPPAAFLVSSPAAPWGPPTAPPTPISHGIPRQPPTAVPGSPSTVPQKTPTATPATSHSRFPRQGPQQPPTTSPGNLLRQTSGNLLRQVPPATSYSCLRGTLH
ncbi:wiskott-Aldrich syndrome protein family member 2-like [Homarus americanus]|uniref:wiskott-Aldrich syndrome protein family member 2-like n=1 Tax=Homarus americanus TaxID=6706 RepID=UPI001C4545A2|nr:wiskott-Aldrich syndrome protein family member 2-like [Homarus americanus]